jgi:hypothetical protein
MNETIWHKLWVLVLIANDVPPSEAHRAFFAMHGNQPIDLNKDPIADALVLFPQRKAKAGGKEDGRTDIASARSDGLLQQSWPVGIRNAAAHAATSTV